MTKPKAPGHPYELRQGEQWKILLWFHPDGEPGAPIVLTGYEFAGQLRAHPQDATIAATIAFSGLVPVNDTAADDTAVWATIEGEQTAALAPGMYAFDIWATPPGDASFCAYVDAIKIFPRVTR